MVKVAHVLLPARSVMINVYVPSVENVVPLLNGLVFIVAHEILVSVKVMVIFPDIYVHEVTHAHVGCVLSIVKVVHVTFPALSCMISVYIPSVLIAVPLVYPDPLSIAHE